MNQKNQSLAESNGTTQSRLAALVGFEEQTDQANNKYSPAATAVEDVKDEATTEATTEVSSPKDTPTVKPPWVKPTNKAYLVLVGAAIVAFLGYLAMAQMLSSPVKKQARTTNKLQEFPIPAAEEENQIGKIKASLAFGDQVEAIGKLNGEYRRKGKPTASPKPLPATKTATPKRETPVAPRIVRSVPSIYPRSIPLQKRVATVTRPSELKPKPVVVAQPPKPEPNPLVVWQQLAQTGSYGQTSGGVQEDVLVADAANQSNSAIEPEVGSIATAEPTITATTAATTTAIQGREPLTIDEVAEAAVISGKPIRTASLLAATTTAARLTTPLSWSDDLQATVPQVALQLEQPLPASNGTTVLPIGTRLIAQVSHVSASGLVEATVVSVVVPQGKDIQEIALSPGTIILTGSEGMPLVAKAKRQKQSSGGINFGQVLKDVLEERYEDLPENLSRRSNRATTGSGTLWYLAAGEPIEILVNQSFELILP